MDTLSPTAVAYPETITRPRGWVDKTQRAAATPASIRAIYLEGDVTGRLMIFAPTESKQAALMTLNMHPIWAAGLCERHGYDLTVEGCDVKGRPVPVGATAEVQPRSIVLDRRQKNMIIHTASEQSIMFARPDLACNVLGAMHPEAIWVADEDRSRWYTFSVTPERLVLPSVVQPINRRSMLKQCFGLPLAAAPAVRLQG